ncbi:VTT domain-containing protein [Proteiniborus sp. MB09-C3]|uniref:DedA family protein n=1 Tax=Proteiniborus sp. MB09-C3 TaxID=3050072 RepID=UPI002552BBCF|nr:VTT domain-containing protein [Proteiniborus sp. MB09-C3]WIV11269.1 hypothetical protein QO263_14065 [Proteiniborus sp. MB09-C3]
MEEFIIDFAHNIVMENVLLSYVFFFASQSLQVLFPPYPGDMVLIIEGYLSEVAHLNIYFIITNAVASTSLSSILLYNIGRKKEEKILHSKVVALLFGTSKIAKLNKLFSKLGALVIVISKFIPGIFSLTLLSAGVFKVKRKSAYLSIIAVSFFHNFVLIALGKLLGENWTIILRKLDVYNRYFIIIAIIAIIIYLIMLQLKKRLLD